MNSDYENEHFLIWRDTSDRPRRCVIEFKSNRKMIAGLEYKYDPIAPDLVAIQHNEEFWTLYNKRGRPMKGAENVHSVALNFDSYTVKHKSIDGEITSQTYQINRDETIKKGIRAWAILGAIIATAVGAYSCVQKNNQKQTEYEQKTQMTYLGISNGVVLFDTDGNKQTAEVISGELLNHQVGRLYGCEGQTHSIAKWKQISQIDTFEKIR